MSHLNQIAARTPRLIVLIPLTLAFLIGWISQRMGLCLVAAITMLLYRRPTLFVALITCGLFGLLLTPLFHLLNVSQPYYQPVTPLYLLIIGGLLFGISSVLNDGCSVGTLTKLARGDISKIMTIIGWVIGIVLWRTLSQFPAEKMAQMPSPTATNYLLAFALVVASLSILIRYQREKHFVGLSILLGLLTSSLFTFEPQWAPSLLFYDIAHGIWSQGTWPISMLRIGVFGVMLLGMFSFTLYRKTFDYQALNPGRGGQYLLAGIIMGASASMMIGGNDSQILLVFPTLTLTTTLPLASVCIGIVLALQVKKGFNRRRNLRDKATV
jgi:uncharacterized membrane protein YedE/YeeE